MANPQKELGHTEIANELLEALGRAEVPGRQRRVFDMIIRKTWGWHKKADKIPLSQLAEMTGINRTHVCDLIRWLKAANMIIRDPEGKTSIQKDYERWVVPPAGLPPKGLPKPRRQSRRREFASPAEGNLPVPPAGLSKETLSKETLSKESMAEIAATPPLAIVQSGPPSPKEEAIRFFTEDKEPIITYLRAQGIPEGLVRQEVAKFIDYWTELNPSGKKQRWELERTFQVKRRFVTWMGRVAHDRRKWSQTKESKGIEI